MKGVVLNLIIFQTQMYINNNNKKKNQSWFLVLYIKVDMILSKIISMNFWLNDVSDD